MQDISLGRISFINVAPVYYALEHNIFPHPFKLVYAPPAELNTAMREGKLSISSCSCVEYARNSGQYLLVRDMSIASHGPVESVLLLSRRPITQLSGATIVVSGQSHTSVVLIKLLMARCFGQKVSYETENVTSLLASGQVPEAVLTIGDEALRLRKSNIFPHILDLASAWREWTNHPFVFGLWIMQKTDAEAWNNAPGCAPDDYVRKSRDYGMAHLEDVLASVRGTVAMTDEELRTYYTRSLTFSLGEEECAGLRHFYTLAHQEGLLETVPKIEFFQP